MADRLGRVLVIAGSDSGGGAGVQADIKTVTALGGYAMSAITALTVQDTLGVRSVHRVSAKIVEAQARAALEDLGADAIKTGMLPSASSVEVVVRVLEVAPDACLVIDPVMATTAGSPLMSRRASRALRTTLVPRADLLTPNAPEAAALTGVPIRSTDDLRRAGEALLELGAKAVLMKGGHVPGDRVIDILMTSAGESVFEGPRMPTRHTHGTGCTLASACATGLAQGLALEAAVARAIDYTAQAIRRAPGLGAGHGPLDHAWPLRMR
ncbi:MAG: bifunctional hydroxymethylpyrimidine kinase/phosphomethylpyrimidine kinase [Caulobacteraceae bacterium]